MFLCLRNSGRLRFLVSSFFLVVLGRKTSAVDETDMANDELAAIADGQQAGANGPQAQALAVLGESLHRLGGYDAPIRNRLVANAVAVYGEVRRAPEFRPKQDFRPKQVPKKKSKNREDGEKRKGCEAKKTGDV